MAEFELSKQEIIDLVRDLYEIKVIESKPLNGYDDLNVLCQIESKETDDSLFVLKITNPIGTMEPNVLESINQAMLFCTENNISATYPLLNREQQYLKRMQFPDGRTRTIRLLKYVKGELLLNTPINPHLLFEAGVFVGQFQLKFQKFECEAVKDRSFTWALKNSLNVRKHLNLINQEWRQSINKALDDFEQLVMNRKDSFPQSIMHGDINEQNMIVQTKSVTTNEGDTVERLKYEFSLIDFGDIHYAPTVFEVTIFVTYILILCFDTLGLESAKFALDGVRSVRLLTEEEMDIIPVCVKARLCQSLVLGAYTASLKPENAYVLSTAKKGWPLLEHLLKISNEKLVKIWK